MTPPQILTAADKHSAVDDLNSAPDKPLRICMVSLHGLIRGDNMELGRDADTGGQVKYVVELARELGRHKNVAGVDLLTRQIIDQKVSADYAQPEERLGENARIVRIPFGPKRYLAKEKLWPYLELFTDQALNFFRRNGIPDVIHGHYADAGRAGAELARLLHVPFVFTGHSLGRVKNQRLLADPNANPAAELEKRYLFAERFEAEEKALETASMIVTSTSQEIDQQYELYDHYDPGRMDVVPPGVDLTLFSPPQPASADRQPAETPSIVGQVERFLTNPDKPPVLAMARPDERKNLEKLVTVFGESRELREHANLILIMGTRDDFKQLPSGQRKVISGVLHLIDKYDLYGSVAYPKTHQACDVPQLYRYATSRRGVFINPALTEPFGLTLLEAGATGLPIVATNDGGPKDIIANCSNGLLIDPLDSEDIERALLRILSNTAQWERWSKNGIAGTRTHYSWQSHADRYVDSVRQIVEQNPSPVLKDRQQPRRIPEFERLIMTDLDNTLTGDAQSLAAFRELLHARSDIGFGVSTGRSLEAALSVLDTLDLPRPDLLDTDAGTQLHYGESLTPDLSWNKQIGYAWKPDQLRQAIDQLPGLQMQPEAGLSEYKISYIRHAEAPSVTAIRRHLRQAGLRARVIVSNGIYVDVVPVRGGSDYSMRHMLYKWGFSAENVLVAGDSGNDAGMLLGRTLGVVVGNHSAELKRLKGRPRVYFAEESHAAGILEGIRYYNFLNDIVIPNDAH